VKTLKYPLDKDQIVKNFLPKIKALAINMASSLPKNVEIDDLIQEGVIGLLQSYERYNPDQNATFYTYALNRIKGAMLDYLRKIDWLPKEVRHLVKEYENLIFSLQEDDILNDEEIIQKLRISEEDLNKIKLSVKKSQIFQLDAYFLQNEDVFSYDNEEKNDPEMIAMNDILKEKLKEKIDNLKEKEKIVLSLYYEKELSFKEIGAVLNVSESRISQIHTAILIKLKKQMEGDD